MKNTMTRKIVLLALIAVFLCVYILQLVFTGRNKIKDVTLEATPDSILVVNGGDAANASNSLRLSFENSAWLVGEKKYPADSSVATKMVDGLKTVKLLGVITHTVGTNADKYGLDAASKITVTAFKDGKSVRTITVGKNASSGSQCYVQIDGKDTVYLADGSLHDTYGVTVDGVRSRDVYTANADDVLNVSITTTAGTFAVQKTAPSADLAKTDVAGKKNDKNAAKETTVPVAAWTITENTTALKSAKPDEEKIAAWTKSLASLKVSSWAAEGESLPAQTPDASVALTADGKEYKVAIYKIDGSEPRYICSANTTPYLFYITKYNAEKYIKQLADLTKE